MNEALPEIIVEQVRKWNGLFVGSLNDEELELFNAAVRAGYAERSYQGAAGFLGLAKVLILM